MSHLKFDKNGLLKPQKINFIIKHNESDEEFIDKYFESECNFRVDYDNEGNPIFKKEKQNRKEEKENE